MPPGPVAAPWVVPLVEPADDSSLLDALSAAVVPTLVTVVPHPDAKRAAISAAIANRRRGLVTRVARRQQADERIRDRRGVARHPWCGHHPLTEPTERAEHQIGGNIGLRG